MAYRSLERTCAELDDGASWRRLFGPLTEHVDGVLGFFLGDKRSLPPDLLTTVRTGLRVLTQGSPAWGLLRGEDARALFTGVGAHAISTMPSPVNSGAGLMLGTLAHTAGWPVPVGGTQAIPDALIADLRAHGGELVLGEPVTAPPDGVVIYDTAPTALLDIYGDAVPSRYAKALRRYRFGPGVCKVDFVLSGEIPWRDARVGAGADACTWAEPGADGVGRTRDRRRAPRRMADDTGRAAAPGRSRRASTIRAAGRCGPTHTCRAGSTADLTETITGNVRARRARLPGPGGRVRSCVPAAQMSHHNANYVGGDIIVGGATLFAAMVGPTLRLESVDHADSEGVPVLVGDTAGHAACTAWRATTPRARCCARSSASSNCRGCRHDDADREVLSWELFGSAADELAAGVAADGFAPDLILAVARGGLFVAGALGYALGVKNVARDERRVLHRGR